MVGSLSLFYQDQAANPTIDDTPAGDFVGVREARLQLADGVLLLAAHISRSVTMTEWLDPSILHEAKPFARDRALNIYDADCPQKPPYSPEFVVQFREAQIARNRRITGWVKAELAQLKQQGEPDAERCFTVQGTMCDVRWTDPTQDPSDRRPYTSYLGEPKLANDGPVGLGRFTTLRSWLSQWSYDESRAHGEKNAARVTLPGAGLSTTPLIWLARRVMPTASTHALASADKEIVHIKDADHYYIERRDLLPKAVAAVANWMDARGFA